jgi:glucose/arabinose dehydrogenase
MRWKFVFAGIALAAALAGGGLWLLAPTVNTPFTAVAVDRGKERAHLARLETAPGYRISIYASGLGRPRLMQITRDGAIIVSTWRDGSLLLVRPDRNGDGRADGVVELATGLDAPHGLLLEGDRLIVAEESRITRYRLEGDELAAPEILLEGLPAGGGHFSRTIARGPDGRLYVSIGSSCNVCIETHPWRAAIIRFREGEAPEIFASGLRNTVGFDWQPGSGRLYGVNAGRDLLGDDFPPEEMNLIEAGRHYGFPYANGRDNAPDPAHGKDRPAGLVITPPVHTFLAHSTPLSIRFLRHQPGIAPGSAALVARHGSWNRTRKSGYDVLLVRFAEDGGISDEPFVTGFELDEDVIGRPVDVVEAEDKAIYISDDHAGVIYRLVRG